MHGQTPESIKQAGFEGNENENENENGDGTNVIAEVNKLGRRLPLFASHAGYPHTHVANFDVSALEGVHLRLVVRRLPLATAPTLPNIRFLGYDMKRDQK